MERETMDYLIGQRRKCGDPVLWAFTHGGIKRLTSVATGVREDLRTDWGPGALLDDAQATALAIAAMLDLEHEEAGELLPQITGTVECLPYQAWILSRGELLEHLAAWRKHLGQRKQAAPSKRKGGKK